MKTYSLIAVALTAGSLVAQEGSDPGVSVEVHEACGAFVTMTEREPNDACGSAALTTPCTSWVGTLNVEGDSDFYEFTVPEPSVLTFETHTDVSTTGLPLVDSKVWLYDASCSLVAFDDDGGQGLLSRLETLVPAGTYAIEISHYQRVFKGDYRLTLERRTTCVDDATAKAMRLAFAPAQAGDPAGAVRFDVEGMLPNSVLHVGFGARGLFVTPLDLAAIGFPGCLLAVRPVVALPVTSTAGDGSGELMLDLSRAPQGSVLHVQGAGLRAAPAAVVASDNRLAWTAPG